MDFDYAKSQNVDVYSIFLHETLHALGLGHDGEYNGNIDHSSGSFAPADAANLENRQYITTMHYENIDAGNILAADTEVLWRKLGTITPINVENDIYYLYNDDTIKAPKKVTNIVDFGGENDTLYVGINENRDDLGDTSKTTIADLNSGGIIEYFFTNNQNEAKANVATLMDAVDLEYDGANEFEGTTIENYISGSNADNVYGNDSKNTFHTGAGDDVVYGGANGDIFIANKGNDTFRGGGVTGIDEGYTEDISLLDGVYYRPFSFKGTTYFDFSGINFETTATHTQIMTSYTIEQVVYADTLIDIEYVSFGNGNDTFKVQSYREEIAVSLGAGEDIAYSGIGKSHFYGDAGNDLIIGNTNKDHLYGGSDRDALFGSVFSGDILDSGDTLNGDTESDILVGGNGIDFLIGGADNDLLSGREGNDAFWGDSDIDTQITGSDTFFIGYSEGHDTIYDFDLSDILVIAPKALFADAQSHQQFYEAYTHVNDGNPVPQGNPYTTGNLFDEIYAGRIPGVSLTVQNGDLILNLLGNNSITIKGGATIDLSMNDRLQSIYDSTQTGNGYADGLAEYVNSNAITWNFQIDGKTVDTHLQELIQTASTETWDVGANPSHITAQGQVVNTSNNNDIVYSGHHANVTFSLYDGDDIFYGYDYNNGDPLDVILTTGTSTIYLGNGDDIAVTQKGNVTVSGGNGNDTITLTDSRVLAWGDNGNDTFHFSNTDNPNSAMATANGGAGDDIFYGGQANDLMYGGADSDTLQGNDGDDHLLGQDGNDALYGGWGNDILNGGAGINTISGGLGNDIFVAEGGTDTFDGGDGIDTLSFSTSFTTTSATINLDTGIHTGAAAAHTYTNIEIFEATFYDDTMTGDANDNTFLGQEGLDTLYGGAGNDILDGGQHQDNLYGGEGNDTLIGGNEADTLNGGAGTDTASYRTSTAGLTVNLLTNTHSGDAAGDTFSSIEIFEGSDFNDTLIADNTGRHLKGADGNDDIDGGNGNDILYGDDGADTIHGSDGDDEIYGGRGDDTLYAGTGIDILYGGDGNDFIDAKTTSSTDRATIYGGDGDDIIKGSKGSDGLYGGTGNDDIVGSVGRDTIEGGTGDDIINGQGSDDIIDGNQGQDTIYGGSGGDTINGGDDNDAVYGESGADTLSGNAGDDVLYGGSGSDILYGGTGNDILDGHSGNEVLYGNEGNDILYGGAWADTLYGGNHDDTLYGGQSNDNLTGGTGADMFIFNTGDGHDVITDFTTTEGDTLVLDQSAFDPGTTLSDIASSAFINGNGDLRINVDTGGSITLEGITSISVAELDWLA